MKYVYMAIFQQEDEGAFTVRFPDLPGCVTFGNGLPDAISMAEDALCLWLYDHEADGKPVPPPSPPRAITTCDDDFVSAISVDTDFYRRFYENSAVKKTLTIPAWLNQQAEEAHINFSQILQNGLKEALEIRA
jgi:predicted RNase H-like HicB family nuclease